LADNPVILAHAKGERSVTVAPQLDLSVGGFRGATVKERFREPNRHGPSLRVPP